LYFDRAAGQIEESRFRFRVLSVVSSASFRTLAQDDEQRRDSVSARLLPV
jgi:hypothetical protein